MHSLLRREWGGRVTTVFGTERRDRDGPIIGGTSLRNGRRRALGDR